MSAIEKIQRELVKRLDDQSDHPVYPKIFLESVNASTLQAVVRLGEDSPPMIVDLESLEKIRKQRELKIAREKEDRFRFRCEPKMWKRIDLMMAKKRLEHPGVQLELLVMGGVRGSKTDFTHSRTTTHFFYTQQAWTWGLHETQASSKTIQQRRIMEFFPPEMNPGSGKLKKDRKTRLTYSDGGGFTGDMFNLEWNCQDENGREYVGGGLFDFKFYKSDESTLQGAELTCAVSDELVPKSICDTVRERLLSRAADTRKPEFQARIRKAVELLEADKELPGPLLAAIYHGVHLIGFTPKEGYSNTVSDFLDGAVTIEETTTHVVKEDIHGVDAEFKQRWGGPEWGPLGKELLPGKMVPRFKQPKKSTRLVAYLHTYDNAHRGNWPAMVQQCQGATEEYIRIIAYGDVSKGWSTRFPTWKDTVHVIDKSQVPRNGTWYHIVDPAGDRNWFMIWALCADDGRLYVVRESPQEGDFIPDVGDPGAWAVTSEHGKRNGDPGPAQQGFGWGFARYKKEIERIEAEIGAWWSPDGSPIKVTERYMDSRLGSSGTPTSGGFTTIMEGMSEEGIEFEPTSGDRLREGDQAILNLLFYNPEAPRGAPDAVPKLMVVKTCLAVIFMFQNYGDAMKPKDEACKDPRDGVAYLVLADPVYQEGESLDAVGGGCY